MKAAATRRASEMKWAREGGHGVTETRTAEQ
jgi:hypothetical protein